VTVFSFTRYPVAPERTEEFDRAVASLLAELRAAPGALWAEGLRALDGSCGYVVCAEWRTDADADAWGSSDRAAAFVESVAVLLGADVTHRRFVSPG
jgi:heme-degrading monooxygenase HmoA